MVLVTISNSCWIRFLYLDPSCLPTQTTASSLTWLHVSSANSPLNLPTPYFNQFTSGPVSWSSLNLLTIINHPSFPFTRTLVTSNIQGNCSLTHIHQLPMRKSNRIPIIVFPLLCKGSRLMHKRIMQFYRIMPRKKSKCRWLNQLELKKEMLREGK
jgi:hypothetical protein